MFRFLGAARWVCTIVLNVFEPTYGPFAHLCSKKITSLLSVDGDDARFSEIAGVTWLHAATIVSICVPGNRWWKNSSIDPRRSSKIREALQLQPWLLLRRWKDVPSCFEAVYHRQHLIIVYIMFLSFSVLLFSCATTNE